MFFSIENLDAFLYCIQQIGVMLSVGAETVLLSAYVLAMEDGKVDDTEAKFSRTVRRALGAGIACMVFSGVIITLLHGSLVEGSIIFQPTFLFKWLLIAVLLVAYLVQRKRPFLNYLLEGVVGGTWYALFLLHIMAPMTGWFVLLMLYVVFVSVFEGIWAGIVIMMRRAHLVYLAPGLQLQPAGMQMAPHMLPPQPKPKPLPPPAPIAPPPVVKSVVPPPPPPQVIVVEVVPPPAPIPLPPPPPPKPAPTVPPPAVPRPMKEAQANPLPTSMPETYTPKQADPPVVVPVPQAPLAPEVSVVAEVDPHNSPWLPAIHVMPKSQEDLDAKNHVTPLAAIIKHA